MAETTAQKASRKSGLRLKGYHWDETTLSQRKRTRLQRLERENYVPLPEFDSMTIAVSTATSSSVIIIGTGDEGLKRMNRRETQRLVAQKQTFADVLAKETDSAANDYQNANGDSGLAAFNYLTCISTPAAAESKRTLERHFCSVCGYRGLYTCVECGMRYCSLACRSTHIDTRCLKHVT
ncbi:hypothetical protein GQ54DRAFT_264842 [Martensiomyces pterosporus]|nr:hypothetical protein GQ54DRAFT_264842 [Martensiomyces pterosporus]